MTDFSSLQLSLSNPYIPRLAENGKFVTITNDSLVALGYPVTGENEGPQGRYAVFTYNLAPITTSPSNPISAVIVNNSQANNLVIYSSTYTNSATVIVPPNTLKSLEVFNADFNVEAYVMLSATSFDSLTSLGLIIDPRSYYYYNQNVDSFTLGVSTGTVDLRVIGHY